MAENMFREKNYIDSWKEMWHIKIKHPRHGVSRCMFVNFVALSDLLNTGPHFSELQVVQIFLKNNYISSESRIFMQLQSCIAELSGILVLNVFFMRYKQILCQPCVPQTQSFSFSSQERWSSKILTKTSFFKNHKYSSNDKISPPNS